MTTDGQRHSGAVIGSIEHKCTSKKTQEFKCCAKLCGLHLKLHNHVLLLSLITNQHFV